MRLLQHFRCALAAATIALASLTLLAPSPAKAWWAPRVGIVVGPPAYYAPPPYYGAPVYYAPRPYYHPPHFWVRAHWRGPYWVPGHWAY